PNRTLPSHALISAPVPSNSIRWSFWWAQLTRQSPDGNPLIQSLPVRVYRGVDKSRQFPLLSNVTSRIELPLQRQPLILSASTPRPSAASDPRAQGKIRGAMQTVRHSRLPPRDLRSLRVRCISGTPQPWRPLINCWSDATCLPIANFWLVAQRLSAIT